MTRRPARSRGARTPHAGTTLVELLIALTVLGIIASGLTTAIVRQQRVNARTAVVIDTRGQSRITLSTLTAELRGISSAGGDIAEMSATAITFREPIGTSIICAIDGGRATFRMPPATVLAAGRFTGWLDDGALPAAGDTAWVFDGSLAVPWRPFGVNGSVTLQAMPSSCPSGAGTFMTAAEAALNGTFVATIVGALPPTVNVGDPVRFTRLVRYSFGQDGTGGPWYLFYQKCSAVGVCDTAQPVSGPFRAGTGVASTTGFRFNYYNSAGAETTNRLAVARVDIWAQTVSREAVSAGNSGGGSARSLYTPPVDSVAVALRNRY